MKARIGKSKGPIGAGVDPIKMVEVKNKYRLSKKEINRICDNLKTNQFNLYLENTTVTYKRRK